MTFAWRQTACGMRHCFARRIVETGGRRELLRTSTRWAERHPQGVCRIRKAAEPPTAAQQRMIGAEANRIAASNAATPRSLHRAGNKRPACKRRRVFLITFWKKRRLLVHAALQNRNFLKQNAYNGKCGFSYSYQGFELLFSVSLILMKFAHFYANLRHLTGNWRKLWRKHRQFWGNQ